MSQQFVFVTAAYKNREWLNRLFDSVVAQDNKNWRMIYVDDASEDGSAELAGEAIANLAIEDRVQIMVNDQRVGALANQYRAIHATNDNEVIIVLDGDDWLARPDALSILDECYDSEDVWMTYGSYETLSDGSRGKYSRQLPELIIERNMFRKYPWVTSHLRTFKSWLFKKIDVSDLKDNESFFTVVMDWAMMYPMLEMAGKHSRYINEILYVHNDANPRNNFKIEYEKLLRNRVTILRRERYVPLDC